MSGVFLSASRAAAAHSIPFFLKICIMEEVKKELMQDFLRRKIRVSLLVLAVFGFFYFCREGLSDGYAARARLSERGGDEAAALSDFFVAAALEEGRGEGDAAVRRSRIFYSIGNFRAAEKELSDAISAGKKSAELYAWLGRVKSAEKEYAEAERCYFLAWQGGESADIALFRARNLIRSGKFAEAERALEEAVRRFPDEELRCLLGLVRANAGKFSPADFTDIRAGERADGIALAEKFFSSAPSADFDADRSLVARADLFRRIGETDLALADLDVVLARNGRYRDAYLVSGKTFFALGDRAEAKDAFEKALLLDGDNAEAIFYLSKICEADGDEERSRDLAARYEVLAG